jgi:NADPH-dependent 2,4-dienoyl-CoA reductase/sulfur reductase-like enzyme
VPGRVAVVGASAAGLSAAEALRAKGFDGELTLAGAEWHLPYDRPPLSKQVLSGVWEPEKVLLRNETAISGLGADLRLGRTAVGLDGRCLLLDDGGRVPFDALVIATGVRPRRLPGADLTGVHAVRTLDDALSLHAALRGRPEVVVVGAGFLGAEVASVARGMGLDVTLVHPHPAPLHRRFGAGIAELIGRTHLDHGVRLRMNTGVARFFSSGDRVTAVELTDGTVLGADVVVVAVGSVPATDWLAGSGVPVRDGVECDALCRAVPGVYAAGDVASWHNPRFGRRMRVEHRLNAAEQGAAVAANILGADEPFAPVPYFWSDQFDVRLQAHGIFPPDASWTVVHGGVAARRFVAACGEHGRVVGVLGWNSPRAVREYRGLVVDRMACHRQEFASSSALEAAAVNPSRAMDEGTSISSFTRRYR